MEEINKDKWTKNIFFTLATIGAAVGLGNLWRFPYMAYENGGGSFFIPFIVCYLVVGLPIVLLEFGVGAWSKGSAGVTFKKINKKFTWIGWWILVNSVVIVAYYAVVMAWSLQYAIYSINESWGNNASAFFFNNVLQLPDKQFQFNNINLFSILCLFIIWLVSFLILRRGLKGLSKALLLTVPLPFILIVIIALRGFSLPGGKEGVEYFLKPDVTKIVKLDVWAAAASQVILSLSLGMGQMIVYASKTGTKNNGLKTGLSLISGDFLFSLLSGIAVFGTLGVMQNGNINIDTGINGPSLAFIVYPTAISSLPLAPLWGFLFFLMLVLLGIDSIFAVIEANVTDLANVFPHLSKTKLLLFFCAFCFVAGIIFTTSSGMYCLDIVDHWVGYFSIFSIVIMQCLIIGTSNKIKEIESLICKWFKNGLIRIWGIKIWKLWIVFLIPAVLIVILLSKLPSEFTTPYGNYSWKAIVIGGWLIFVLAIAVGFLIAWRHNKTND
ncbi:MAG: sodium-dependent transporter [Bacteroidales bacterium]|nr:sodium-dependent transporter [Bacteroidales bacterium]